MFYSYIIIFIYSTIIKLFLYNKNVICSYKRVSTSAMIYRKNKTLKVRIPI